MLKQEQAHKILDAIELQETELKALFDNCDFTPNTVQPYVACQGRIWGLKEAMRLLTPTSNF